MSALNNPAVIQVLRHVSLSEEQAATFISFLRNKKIKKKEVLLHAGAIAKDAAFVVSGCFRSFQFDENGNEVILQFAPENWWITDNYSFISQQPNRISIDCIESGEIFLLSREDQKKLFDVAPPFERYFRIISENALVAHQQLVMDNLGLTAQERYEKFCRRYPTLVDKIAQKHIASYIGVTPEFLSKMKAQLLRAK
jgi:CRP-like cAMP-binding protein